MSNKNVVVTSVAVRFLDVRLSTPFRLANATIQRYTLATVDLTVTNSTGHTATGRGTVPLSVPWSWPGGDLPFDERDHALRTLTEQLGQRALSAPAGDPFEIWHYLQAGLDESPDIPHLARMLALGAVDNAVHDAWATLAGLPVWEMYTGEFLNSDLGRWLGSGLDGRYLQEFLGPARLRLPVQHAVGVDDPLDSGPVKSLTDWLREEQSRHVKLKLFGRDSTEDTERIAAVHRVLTDSVADPGRLALDPNEGYRDPADLLATLDQLRTRYPDAAKAVHYIEQPFPRGLDPDPAALQAISERYPLLLDEGLTDLDTLRAIPASGWTGLVVKAAKGQSFAVLCYCWAKANGLFVAVQDLTAVGVALEHSARMASQFGLSSEAFEYNSHQYAPRANDSLRAVRPELVDVHNGYIEVGPVNSPGLY